MQINIGKAAIFYWKEVGNKMAIMDKDDKILYSISFRKKKVI